jgi:hypothetical protein
MRRGALRRVTTRAERWILNGLMGAVALVLERRLLKARKSK